MVGKIAMFTKWEKLQNKGIGKGKETKEKEQYGKDYNPQKIVKCTCFSDFRAILFHYVINIAFESENVRLYE